MTSALFNIFVWSDDAFDPAKVGSRPTSGGAGGPRLRGRGGLRPTRESARHLRTSARLPTSTLAIGASQDARMVSKFVVAWMVYGDPQGQTQPPRLVLKEKSQ